MTDVFLEAFNNQIFFQVGVESTILKIIYYILPILKFQQVSIKEKVHNIEFNGTRYGYIIDTLTSVDIHEIVKIGGKVIEIYQGVIHWEKFKISPITKVIEKIFAFGQKDKKEGKELMQGFVKLIMNSSYGVQIRKDINEFYKCKSKDWMQTEYDDNVSG